MHALVHPLPLNPLLTIEEADNDTISKCSDLPWQV